MIKYKPKNKKAIKYIWMLLASILFVVSSTIVIIYFKSMFDSQKLNEELQNIHNKTAISATDQTANINTSGSNNNTISITNTNIQQTQEYTTVLPGMQELIDKNPDTAGWITIPGTQVDNVVVQGDDNKFYLTHNFNGKRNEAGTIFVDRNCKILPVQDCDNLVLYGHNQMDGSMFGTLTDYKKDPMFVLNAPVINLSTNYVQSQYVIFAYFIINADSSGDDEPIFPYHEYINFNDVYDFNYWINEVKRRSLITSQVETLETDQYITLSTCAVEFDTARFVVIGRKIRDNDNITTGYAINNNAYFPDIYYEKNGSQYQY